MKTALVYDWVNKWGGAERILLALHEIFPDAPLHTAVYDKKETDWAKVFKVKTSFLQNVSFAKNNHEYFLPFLPFAFESFNFDEYDLVISISSSFAKYIVTKPDTIHINYCLTPTRYFWSNYSDYFDKNWKRMFSKSLIKKMKKWDLVASQRPDFYLAISENVKQRIKKYYNKNSEVVYPPVDLPAKYTKPLSIPQNYYLIVSRLVSYKKIAMAVQVFKRLNLPLIIVGKGREEKKLKSLASGNVVFLKDLTDGELSWYYRHCRALIMPQEEDFGLTAVEAQFFGKPVIAFKKGGVLETVIDKKTGIFFYPQTAEKLEEAVRKFNTSDFQKEDCVENAKRFNKEKFKREFLRIISKYLKK